MTDRAGVFAAYAELLTEMCAYYLLIGLMFMAGHGWNLPLGWVLLCTTVYAVFFRLLLRRPRGAQLLTALTVLLIAAAAYAFWRIAGKPTGIGHLLALTLGAGMAAGLSLYHCLHRPTIMQHLSHLDGQILLLFVMLLFGEAHEVLPGDTGLSIAVLLLDAAACVGLRMSDGDGADSGDALRASLLALGAALILALLILLAMAVFSRSGTVTGAVLHGIGAALSACWSAIERFVGWLASLFARSGEASVPLELDTVSGEIAADYSGAQIRLPVSPTVVFAVVCVLVLAAAFAVARLLRHERAAAAGGKTTSAAGVRIRRRSGVIGRMWARFCAAVRFRWTAFVRRDTPGGVLVWLERRSRRTCPRGTGESMRAFLRRLDPAGGLEELADALDREYYGGKARTMSPRRCRELRRRSRQLFRKTAGESNAAQRKSQPA